MLGLAYNDGFKKPIGPFPTLILSSLIRLMTAEKIGVLADVPPLSSKSFPLYTYYSLVRQLCKDVIE